MWITIAAFLVFFMHAGFTLLESGMTQSKNAVNIAMKNLMAISVGTVVYWLIGYSLMFGETSNGYLYNFCSNNVMGIAEPQSQK